MGPVKKFIAPWLLILASTSCISANDVLEQDRDLPAEQEEVTDAFSWLEEINAERSREWVAQQNAKTQARLRASPRFQRFAGLARSIHHHSERLAFPGAVHGDWVYNLWQDKAHPRGLWRRGRLDAWLRGAPEWQTLLDLDALAIAEGRPWTFQNTTQFLGDRALVTLVNEASGKAAIREFDLSAGAFVADGFNFDETLGQSAVWADADAVIAATDWGPESMSPAGLPRVVKVWARSQPRTSAVALLDAADHELSLGRLEEFSDGAGTRLVVLSAADRNNQISLWAIDRVGGARRLTRPPKASLTPLGIHRGQWIVHLTGGDWELAGRVWKNGSVLAMPLSDVAATHPRIEEVVSPAPRETVFWGQVAGSGVLIGTYENVRARLWTYKFDDARWTRARVPLPDDGTVSFITTRMSGALSFVTFESFTSPTTLYAIDISAAQAIKLQTLSHQYDVQDLATRQLEAVSKDGTRVPYFIVHSKSLRPDGKAPTILWGYGSGGVIETPKYDGALGKLWLEQGGVFVLANIRGGGELGPGWEVQGAQRARTYEDFIAVAEDLIRRRITSARYLGIRGHSNGGLLVGVALNWRPELFNAAVIENPALDQLAQRRLLPDVRIGDLGAWDNPDDVAFIRATSPYQNLRKVARFPPPFIATASTDGSVFVFSARKYAAKLLSYGIDCFFHEQSEGGHAPWGVTADDRAHYDALVYTYFAERLMW